MLNQMPSKTSLGKILNDCKIDPRKPGPFRVIADIADGEYYRKRAIECLHENKLKEAIIFISFALFYKGTKRAARKINPNTLRKVPEISGSNSGHGTEESTTEIHESGTD